MYLTERRLLFSINHVFSSLTGPRDREDFVWFRDYFPAVETRNSHMLERANANAAKLAKRWQKIEIGGSDAHALPSAGTAYTEVPGARDKEEFFAGLRNGMGRVAGESGCFSKLTRDVFIVAYEMMREKNWTALLSPLSVLIPAFTFLNYCEDEKFCRRWGTELLGQPEVRKRPRWISAPQPAVEECV
jgi:predicted metal-dependent phosphoesterase TrpH